MRPAASTIAALALAVLPATATAAPGALDPSFSGDGWTRTLEVRSASNNSPYGGYARAVLFHAGRVVVGYSWYDQGTRFVDVSDPTNPVQVAYYRPDDGVSWAPYYHNGYVFVADHGRGVDILKLKSAAGSGKEVVAPTISERQQRLAAKASRGLRADPVLGWMCPLPA